MSPACMKVGSLERVPQILHNSSKHSRNLLHCSQDDLQNLPRPSSEHFLSSSLNETSLARHPLVSEERDILPSFMRRRECRDIDTLSLQERQLSTPLQTDGSTARSTVIPSHVRIRARRCGVTENISLSDSHHVEELPLPELLHGVSPSHHIINTEGQSEPISVIITDHSHQVKCSSSYPLPSSSFEFDNSDEAIDSLPYFIPQGPLLSSQESTIPIQTFSDASDDILSEDMDDITFNETRAELCSSSSPSQHHHPIISPRMRHRSTSVYYGKANNTCDMDKISPSSSSSSSKKKQLKK